MISNFDSLINPKRHFGAFLLHNFYAGYNPAFVESVLDLFDLSPKSTVFDPWNGSGTTTRVASQRGFEAIGFDINPTMIVVARATCADKSTFNSSISTLVEAILHSKPHEVGISQHTFKFSLEAKNNSKSSIREPFELWFCGSTAKSLRVLEKRIFSCLGGASRDLQDLSPLAAFFYLAFFNTVRTLVNSFCGSNPTWIKMAKEDKQKLSLSRKDIADAFRRSVTELCICFDEAFLNDPCGNDDHLSKSVKLQIADASSLPLSDSSVDAIVSSPPYCTRIDYGVATRPELAALGYDDLAMDSLRRTMLGANTVPRELPPRSEEWGTEGLKLFDAVQSHTSRASRGYYDKWIAQYLQGLSVSLCEISRVMRPGARCALVVQDSFYKDVLIDLANITSEMAQIQGLRPIGQVPHKVAVSLASINSRSKPYRSHSPATESILLFSKSS